MFSFIRKRLMNTSSRHFLLEMPGDWNISVSNSSQAITFASESSGENLRFPSVWLRDNCQCAKCFDKSLHSRLTPFKYFTSNILPCLVTCNENDQGVVNFHVEWPDKHESVFELEWLREHDFSPEAQKKWLTENYQFQKETWNASTFHQIIRYFSYEALLESDLELLRWLVTLNRRGVAIIRGAGRDEGQVHALASRIGFLKKTTYGELYRVEAKPGATNAAYLPTPLELHIDLPYYQYCPSFNILHYTLQSKEEKEGENQLVDALSLCKQIKSYDESMYTTLCNTVIDWTDKGMDVSSEHEFHHINRAPVICENSEGIITRINFSQHQRDAHFCGSIEEANKWYKAMNWLIHLSHHPRNQVSLKMNEGEMLTFDNLRVLHGRSAFTTSRCVIGGYLDGDIVNSRIRVLLSKLKLKVSEID